MRGAWRRGMGVNNKEGMMKTSWGKPVHIIRFCRTLLIVLTVAVCTVAADDLETLRKKAEAGDAVAQYNLGLMYEKGTGLTEDKVEAAKWYRKAAEQGDANAQVALGLMYFGASGVPLDYAEAVKWFRRAAEQGHAKAQNNLGGMYFAGRGVPQDDAEALKWFRKAAEQGHAKVQYNLGAMYEMGRGVASDDVAAYAWYSVAAASGHDNARKNCDRIKPKLTPSELEKGEAMAREISEGIEKEKAAGAE